MDMDKLGDFFSQAMTKREEMLSVMDKLEVEAEAGGGLVRVRMNGRKQILKLTLAPAAMAAAGNDITLLEDLITAAFNEAGRKAVEAMESTSRDMLGDFKGIGLPGL